MAAVTGAVGQFSAVVSAVELVLHCREWTIDSIGGEDADITQFSGPDWNSALAYEEITEGTVEIVGTFIAFGDQARSGGYVEATLNSVIFDAILTATTSRLYTFMCGFPSIEFDIQVGKPVMMTGTFKSVSTGAAPVIA